MKYRAAFPVLLVCWGLSACSTDEIIGGTVGATILGANIPSQEIVRGILSPIEMSAFKFFWDQGWPREESVPFALPGVGG